VGFVPDSLASSADTTVFEYLDFFGRAYGLRGASLKRSVADVVEFAGLGNMLNKTLSSLSKGMKQRVSVGRALVHDPKVMLLDEPAAGLDPRARIELRELLRALAGMGKSILISSHILTELTEICDGVVIIEKGQILADGKVKDVLASIRSHNRIEIRSLDDPERVRRELMLVPCVCNPRVEGNYIVADVEGGDEEVCGLLDHLVQHKCRIFEFRAETVDLEDIFMEITKGVVQ
jgi:ABC-2 type transport system ATP-binding protein